MDNENSNNGENTLDKNITILQLYEDVENFMQRLRIVERKNRDLEEQLHELTKQFEPFMSEHSVFTTQEIYEKQEQCMNISHELWVQMITFYADTSTNKYKLAFIVDIMQSQNLAWPARPSERQATYALGLLAEYQASIAASNEACQENQAQHETVMETSSQKINTRSEGWNWRGKDWGFFKKKVK